MLTIIAFVLTILGSVNWLLIGLLQYDFIAGIFGYQASVFSRIIYIVLGASSVILIFKLFKNKGTLPVFTWRNKKDVMKNIDKMRHKNSFHLREENIEASSSLDEDPPSHRTPSGKGLFDEHFDDKEGL